MKMLVLVLSALASLTLTIVAQACVNVDNVPSSLTEDKLQAACVQEEKNATCENGRFGLPTKSSQKNVTPAKSDLVGPLSLKEYSNSAKAISNAEIMQMNTTAAQKVSMTSYASQRGEDVSFVTFKFSFKDYN